MGLIIPKCNAEPETLDLTLKVYYDANDWVANADLIDKLSRALINAGIETKKKEPQSYTKKTQVLSYYGLLEWEDETNTQSRRRITENGRKLYEYRLQNDTPSIQALLLEVLRTNTFGRNVLGCDSDSDLEAPNIFLKSCMLIKDLTNKEFGYILGKMEFSRMELVDALFDVAMQRNNGITVQPDAASAKWSDPKPILALADWGLFEVSKQGNYKTYNINRDVLLHHANDLIALRTKNTETQRAVSSRNSTHPVDVKTTTYFSYLTAIKTKPFLILGGFSGTGKSQKVKELAYLTCPTELQGEKTPGNYALISVKPNWHDSTELLGYETTIANKYMVTDFMRFVVKAMQHPNTPFFCCMDEMNLAPVEEYFAEYLSVLESRKKVQDAEGNWHIVSEPLVSADVFTKEYKGATYNIFEDLGLKKVGRTVSKHESSSIGAGTEISTEVFDREDIITMLKQDGLCIPENLVVIGTVNMDDTTNSFSRKVIDRAMIFETDIETFSKEAYFGATDTLQYGNVDGKAFIADEVRADKAIEAGYDLSEEDRQTIIDYINELNKAMAGTSFQISYRVLNETILYYRSMQLLNEGQASLEQVKNDILMMKVLPRIEGDSAAKKALIGLKTMIEKNVPAEWVNVPYDVDAETIASKPETPWKDSVLKIAFMLNMLNTGDGFTRFWK